MYTYEYITYHAPPKHHPILTFPQVVESCRFLVGRAVAGTASAVFRINIENDTWYFEVYDTFTHTRYAYVQRTSRLRRTPMYHAHKFTP